MNRFSEQIRVAWVHLDIKNRIHEFHEGIYPRSHLWGYPLKKQNKKNILNPLVKNCIIIRFCSIIDKVTRNRLGNSWVEISLIYKRKQFDAVYCVSGHLFWIPILKKLGILEKRIIILLYKLPKHTPWWKFHDLHHSIFILKCYDGINCLTIKLKNDLYSAGYKGLANNLSWGTDLQLFKPKKYKINYNYFFSNGKTNRDYMTLLEAIKKLPNISFKAIAHWGQHKQIPHNLEAIKANTEITDKAITYAELARYYEESIAVCIPLNEDSEDTCGYTECLEALAMGKPVLMTRTGCLDIDIEKEGVGIYINPNDSHDWVRKLKMLNKNRKLCDKMGAKGKEFIRNYYDIKDYNIRVHAFISEVLSKA